MQQAIALIVSIAVAQIAGFLGTLFTADAIPSWYVTLAKPWFTPPSWVFAPVWTILYTLMGVAAYLIYKRRKVSPGTERALLIYTLQLTLNSAWSVIFFGAHELGWALIEMIVLAATIAYTMVLFARIDRRAAALLLPYLAWVLFAAALNTSIWRLNA